MAFTVPLLWSQHETNPIHSTVTRGVHMMVGAWWAWPLALAVYLVFRAWYDNWRGPLSQAEIEAFLAETAKTKVGEHTDRAVIRAFLEADDGKEFIMRIFLTSAAAVVTTQRHGQVALFKVEVMAQDQATEAQIRLHMEQR